MIPFKSVFVRRPLSKSGATSRALPDSSHLAKKLANIHFCLYQGTSYQNKSEMKTPTDLLQEKIVLFNFLGRKRNNQIELNHLESGKRVELTLQPSIIFNDAGAAIEAVRSGLGIALLPDFLCLDYVSQDFIKKTLTDWQGHHASIYAIFPSRKYLLPKTRAFAEAVKQAYL